MHNLFETLAWRAAIIAFVLVLAVASALLVRACRTWWRTGLPRLRAERGRPVTGRTAESPASLPSRTRRAGTNDAAHDSHFREAA